ncbi:MAG: septum formation initiator family protein [Akkermansiaceae bacterium]|nr:septum formation initiator family protein [Akkermansiaceae bacterium]
MNTPQEMAKKRFTADKLARLEGATRFIQGINKLFYILLAIAFGLLIAATAAPQKRDLDKLQRKLQATQEREDEALAHKEHKEIQLQALREDPSYLEIQARDRLNYYRKGERVLRFGGER